MSAHARLAALTAAGTLAVGLAVAPGAIAATPHTSANAHAVAASCGSNHYQKPKSVKHKKSGAVTITLRYSTKCRTAWALETGGKVHDHLWVYNKNTHKTKGTHIHSGTSNHSHWVSDKGTKSHACVQRPGGAKVCTGYY